MADILFIHSNFPGQFGFLAEALASEGHRCTAIASGTGRDVPGVRVVRWKATGTASSRPRADIRRIEADLIRADAAGRVATSLQDEGFSPDLIISHPGWGESIYMREIFPRARQIAYGEYYYRSRGGDVGFDPEFPPTLREPYKVFAKNAAMAMALAEADAIVCPTAFQQSLLPAVFRAKCHVIHEGVDTRSIRRRTGRQLTLVSGKVLDGKSPIVTFASRRLEPLRGIHAFMRALPLLQAEVPGVEVVIIGADEGGGYGMPAPRGTTWGRRFYSEVASRVDPERIHIVGRLPHEMMLTAISLSAAHVYLTYPFVLSWSLLEAMACGALVVASDTPPVRDVVDGLNGLLVDFFDHESLSRTLIDVALNPAKFANERQEARTTVVDRFDRETVCKPRWLSLIGSLLADK